jgi:ATP-dependent Lhr-like helicase
MDAHNPLDLFLSPVRAWFRETLGQPTPPQVQGWPEIAAGRHTLILAPTGSGKTLAAFLACLDSLWRQPALPRGVQVLYISPLKALNNDIHRNLQVPLEGVQAVAERMGREIPIIETAVRTGDTPASERARLLRRPPHVLITTPESLHLLLTSRAREALRSVRYVIVDEIHAVCPSKRGVFLSLLLERLQAQVPREFTRIGLSATQRPLEEVARFLGGARLDEAGTLVPRPVTIIDTGKRKDLDLRVLCPVEQFGPLPERSIWPSIYRLLADQIHEHTSTIVFANDRRSVERITSFLNEPADPEGEAVELARAHHGSVSLEVRHDIESQLKGGRLKSVVATGSLEMGIDMGAVDLVVQVAPPGQVARALQRVGRAGHLVGQRSKGRLIPRTAADLVEMAAVCREMHRGQVEEIRVPINCLDVLAQQIVACVAMDTWSVPELFGLVRRAYPYRDLSAQAFETTLEMVTGRFRFSPVPQDGGDGLSDSPRPPEGGEGSGVRGANSLPGRPGTLEALQPRISWDRVHNRLMALPGTHQLALVNGGTIPDTGNYAVYGPGNVRLGELDEEFIYERRVGDTFLLGTNSWRVDRIQEDRVLVVPAEGAMAVLPFWRGEGLGRSADLGQAMGAFLRELLDRIDDPQRLAWLQGDFHLDPASARNLVHHVTRQVVAAGCVPTDRTILVEGSRDQLGDWQVMLLSHRGSRVHLGLRLALEGALSRRLGYRPQCLHHDDGILLRLTDTDEPILDLFAGITEENVEQLILDELADSALFALRFRQNAARSLLLPRGQPGKRSPLWLQRLRGKDLLQVARRQPDFPIVVETFRECLHDHLDLPRLKQLLRQVRDGEIEVVQRRAEVPSPFAGALLFAFTAAFLYQPDQVEAEGTSKGLDTQLLQQLVAPEQSQHLLDARAVQQVERRLRGVGMPPRSPAEMAEWLRRLGDLSPAELEGPMEGFLETLAREGIAERLELPGVREPVRWVLTEEAGLYRTAFLGEPGASEAVQTAATTILARFLQTHALVGLADVLARYPFEPGWAERQLTSWARSGRAVVVQRGGPTVEFSAPENLEQLQRGSLAILRREVVTCSAPHLVDFLLRWQYVHPTSHRGGPEGLADVLDRLQGLALEPEVWEQVVLPARVPGYQPRWLDDWCLGGTGVVVGREDVLSFRSREALGQTRRPVPESEAEPSLDEVAGRVLDALRQRGAVFTSDLAITLNLPPSSVRSALWTLFRRGLVSNDQMDVLRRGADGAPTLPERTQAVRARPVFRSQHRAPARPEGRWFAILWGSPEPEGEAVFQAYLLLNRYGIVSREMAGLDPTLRPWRVLYEVFSRLEMAGEVRRGYFAEGLSGAQFALPEAADLLQETQLPSTATAPVLLLHSLDPANLYGSGAPLDIPLLDGGTRPLLRRTGNWLTLRAGRPILLIEQQGKKLTALPSASRDDLTAATALLPRLLDRRPGTSRHKLTVEEWNGAPPVTSPVRELLEAAGFVRDYQGMTLWATW